MGYDVHLTRKEFWADEEGPEISIEEWRAYVSTDPEIESDAENPGDESYVLKAHPERWRLWWHRSGEIYTKNPDKLVVAKLVQVAQALGARVLGDDDEVYGVDPLDPMVFERR